MKKKNTLFYLIVLGVILLGAILGIVVNVLMGNSLAAMFSSTTALTIYLALGAFGVVFIVLLLLEWGRR